MSWKIKLRKFPESLSKMQKEKTKQNKTKHRRNQKGNSPINNERKFS